MGDLDIVLDRKQSGVFNSSGVEGQQVDSCGSSIAKNQGFIGIQEDIRQHLRELMAEM